MTEEERKKLFELPKGEFGDKKKEIFRNTETPSETIGPAYSKEALMLAFYDHNPVVSSREKTHR